MSVLLSVLALCERLFVCVLCWLFIGRRWQRFIAATSGRAGELSAERALDRASESVVVAHYPAYRTSRSRSSGPRRSLPPARCLSRGQLVSWVFGQF